MLFSMFDAEKSGRIISWTGTGWTSQTNSRQPWQATKQPEDKELPSDAANLQSPVHVNQSLIVLQTCASSFFMHQAGERQCDVKLGTDAAVRRRSSVGVTLQQTR